MSTHTSSAGPPPGASAPQRLARSITDRHIAGVAGGLGEHFGVDPTLVRIAFIILTVLGGSGVALYLLAWVLLPAADQSESMAGSLLHHQPGHPWPRQAVVLGAIAAVVVLGAVDHPHHFGLLGPLLIVALIALWVTRRDHTAPFPPAAATAGTTLTDSIPTDSIPTDSDGSDPQGEGADGPGATDESASTATGPPGETPVDPLAGSGWDTNPGTWPMPLAPMPVAVPARRSGVTAVTLSAIVALAGAVLLIDVAGLGHIGAFGFFAAALAVTGAGLVVSAWRRRAWGLVPVAFVLVGALGVTAATGSVRGGIGDRTFHPADITAVGDRYDLAAGTLALDLADVHPAAGVVTRVKAGVAAGHLVVTVPADERVMVKARSGIGVVELFDRSRRGTSVDMAAVDAPAANTGTAGTIALDLHAGFGDVEVRRAA